MNKTMRAALLRSGAATEADEVRVRGQERQDAERAVRALEQKARDETRALQERIAQAEETREIRRLANQVATSGAPTADAQRRYAEGTWKAEPDTRIRAAHAAMEGRRP